jgi:hypothetical protein
MAIACVLIARDQDDAPAAPLPIVDAPPLPPGQRKVKPDDYDRRQAHQDAHQDAHRKRPRPTGPAGRRIRARSRF